MVQRWPGGQSSLQLPAQNGAVPIITPSPFPALEQYPSFNPPQDVANAAAGSCRSKVILKSYVT